MVHVLWHAAAASTTFCSKSDSSRAWGTPRGAFSFNESAAGRRCLLRSASTDESSLLVRRNASFSDVALSASFFQHAYAAHGLLQLLVRVQGGVADSDTLEAQPGYACLWSSALASGASSAKTTVHLRAGERVLAASETFDARVNVLYEMRATAVGDAIACNVTGGGVDIRLAASDAAYSAGSVGLEVYKGDAAFFQAIAVSAL